MSRQNSKLPALFLIALVVFTGCHPTQPFYLQNDGDLSHYIDTATELEAPDVAHRTLDEVTYVHSPFTLTNPEFTKYWDLTLEQCVAMALQNSKNIRQGGGANIAINQTVTALGRFNASGNSIYDPAVFETSNAGVEAALSRFDAQFTSSLRINTTDRPQNFTNRAGPFFSTVLVQNDANFSAEINKISAIGTQYFLRHTINYNRGNRGGGSRALRSAYTSAIEMEARHPLLRGAGALVNRLPVVISRINTDMQLAQFEARVRDLVYNTERAYWDLYCSYHILETAKISRDSVKKTRDLSDARFRGGQGTKQDLEQANEQYFFFRSLLEASLAGDSNTGAPGVFESERALRFLMGLSATDGRLIRPIDEPTTARVEFDWHDIHAEAMVRSPELREQQWLIKRRENELILARNQLLPQLNLTLLYRWLGVGDNYGGGNRRGLDFPQAGSSSLDNLTQGDFQEASVGVDFTPPKFGARAELAGVRNGQVQIAREHARLEDMELELSHLLSSSVRNLDSQFKITQSNFNRWVASEDEVRLRLVEWQGGKGQLDTVLDAQRRLADGRTAFFRTLCAYNKAIATVHYQKGSILEYDGVKLAEGPWPKKAYWDALGHARRRDSSYYLNYGWSRPGVISKGPIQQGVEGIPEEGEILLESIPAGQPTPAPATDAGGPTFAPIETQTHAAPGDASRTPVSGDASLTPVSGDASANAFVWDLGLSSGAGKKAATKIGGSTIGKAAIGKAAIGKAAIGKAAASMTFDAQVRPVSHIEWVESKASAK